MSARRLVLLPLAPALAVSVALSGCGDDDADAGGVADGVLEVVLTDFSFGDLPDEIPAGTRVVIDNQSPSELHEFVAVRLPDGDERTTAQVLEDGLDDLLSAGPPAAVLLAAPGAEPVVAVGDGVLAEPGRYLLLCAIPTGADPGEYLAAAGDSDGPPDVPGGPPHFVNGMVDDIVVTPA